MKIWSIILFIFISFSLLVIIKSDPQCIINGLEADSCDFTNPVNQTYYFTTTNLTTIDGYFEIPLNTYLDFIGPVKFNNGSTIKFNCETDMTDNRCLQIYSNTSIISWEEVILLNISIDLDRELVHDFPLFDYNWGSSYPDDPLRIHMIHANVETKYNYNISYFYFSTFNFEYKKKPVSKALTVNISCNCIFFDDGAIYQYLDYANFKKIYVFSNLTKDSCYIVVNTPAQMDGPDPKLAIDVLNDRPNMGYGCHTGSYKIPYVYNITVLDVYGNTDYTTIAPVVTPLPPRTSTSSNEISMSSRVLVNNNPMLTILILSLLVICQIRFTFK